MISLEHYMDSNNKLHHHFMNQWAKVSLKYLNPDIFTSSQENYAMFMAITINLIEQQESIPPKLQDMIYNSSEVQPRKEYTPALNSLLKLWGSGATKVSKVMFDVLRDTNLKSPKRIAARSSSSQTFDDLKTTFKSFLATINWDIAPGDSLSKFIPPISQTNTLNEFNYKEILSTAQEDIVSFIEVWAESFMQILGVFRRETPRVLTISEEVFKDFINFTLLLGKNSNSPPSIVSRLEGWAYSSGIEYTLGDQSLSEALSYLTRHHGVFHTRNVPSEYLVVRAENCLIAFREITSQRSPYKVPKISFDFPDKDYKGDAFGVSIHMKLGRKPLNFLGHWFDLWCRSTSEGYICISPNNMDIFIKITLELLSTSPCRDNPAIRDLLMAYTWGTDPFEPPSSVSETNIPLYGNMTTENIIQELLKLYAPIDDANSIMIHKEFKLFLEMYVESYVRSFTKGQCTTTLFSS